jgi:7,8-dihydropterin-6-yl-methyl-4-(beta-D-ribofuranosyl)aminobenzene 5'-phosphate synthase
MTQYVKITIVFDNYRYLPDFPTLWGFSAFIETDTHTLLFDTGSNGRVLLQNMQKLDIDLKKADTLFISHPHWDHIGGIDSVLEANHNLDLYVPASLSRHLVHDLEKLSRQVRVIGKAPEEIYPSFYTTGTMGEIGEQSLIIETATGLIVVTGCAHPGIEHIAQKAITLLQKPIVLLMGGFHLMYSDKQHISSVIETLQQLGVENVAPTHCSGDLAIEMFSAAFGEHFIQGGTGRIIEIGV